MSERRINYSKDMAEVIRRLLASDDTTGPFDLIANVLVFAAAFGLHRKHRVKLSEPLAEPIRQSVFDRQGYDTMMNLVALHADPRPAVLGSSEEATAARAQAFEEFANGGLELLQEEIRGARDVLETLILIVSAERTAQVEGTGEFDLSKLLA